MNRDDIIRMAADAGITPWVHHQWVKDKFIHIDEGMDGDLACLMQFASLVAAAEREALKAALAEPEQIPPEAQTEAEKVAYCAGWWAAMQKAREMNDFADHLKDNPERAKEFFQRAGILDIDGNLTEAYK